MEVCAPSQTSGVKKMLSSIFFTLSGMPLAGAKNLAVQQGCNGRILCKKVEIPLTFSGAAAQLQCNQNKGNIHRKSKTQTIRKANH